jgi:hypothetical protein
LLPRLLPIRDRPVVPPSETGLPHPHIHLRAHHVQAQRGLAHTVEATALWNGVEALVESEGLPERSVPAVLDAAYGSRLRRSDYDRSSGVEAKAAGR